MSIILHPERWTRQPPAGTRLNFGHVLAKGLTFYVLFNAGGGLQRALLPTNLPGTFVGSNPAPAWNTSPGGLSRNYGAGGVTDWYERGIWVEPPTVMTAMGRIRRTGTLPNTSLVLRKTYNNNGSSPFTSWDAIQLNPGNGGQDTLQCGITTAGTLHSGNIVSLAAGATSKEMTTGLTYDGANLKTWVNGISKDSVAVTGAISYDQTATGRLIVSGITSAAATLPFLGNIYWIGVWNRPLSAAEIEWLHTEPYAMLLPPAKYRRYFATNTVAPPVGGKGGVVVIMT